MSRASSTLAPGGVLVRGGRLFDPSHSLDRVGDLLARDGVVVAAGAFADDGSWLADDALAERAFRQAASAGVLLMEHCEDFALTGPGVLHDGAEARAAGVPGIPRSAEDRATARDIALARRFRTRL